jgi:hypothetical protein
LLFDSPRPKLHPFIDGVTIEQYLYTFEVFGWSCFFRAGDISQRVVTAWPLWSRSWVARGLISFCVPATASWLPRLILVSEQCSLEPFHTSSILQMTRNSEFVLIDPQHPTPVNREFGMTSLAMLKQLQ